MVDRRIPVTYDRWRVAPNLLYVSIDMRTPVLLIVGFVLLASAAAQARPRVNLRQPVNTRPGKTQHSSLERWHRQFNGALPVGRRRDSLKRRSTRAATFNSLMAAVRHPRKAKIARSAAVKTLLDFAQSEPTRPLKMYAVGSLLKHRIPIPKAQKKRFNALRRQVFPTRPAIPKKGPVEVRHFVGDEFYRGEVAGYRRQGFSVTSHGDSAVATRGRLRIKIYKGDQHIFRHMGDPKVNVVLFSGHSDVGGVNELALKGSPRQRGDKLLVLLQCVGTQTMPMVGSRYSKAHLLTTKRSSYADADWNIIRSLMDGLERGDNYRQIRGRARQGGNNISNYLFPDHRRSMRYWDLDRDGHREFGKKRLADRRFNVADGRKRAPGQKLMSAVRYLNSTHKYYAEDTPGAVFSTSQVFNRLHSGGVAKKSSGARKPRKVTRIRTKRVNGKKVYDVKLDPRFLRASKAFVGASSIYEMHSHITRKVHGRQTRRDKLRSMLFAGDYLFRLSSSLRQANCAVDRMCRMKNLPKLKYRDLERVIISDQHALGTGAQLDALERLAAARKRAP